MGLDYKSVKELGADRRSSTGGEQVRNCPMIRQTSLDNPGPIEDSASTLPVTVPTFQVFACQAWQSSVLPVSPLSCRDMNGSPSIFIFIARSWGIANGCGGPDLDHPGDHQNASPEEESKLETWRILSMIISELSLSPLKGGTYAVLKESEDLEPRGAVPRCEGYSASACMNQDCYEQGYPAWRHRTCAWQENRRTGGRGRAVVGQWQLTKVVSSTTR